jgi:hypothetical protein
MAGYAQMNRPYDPQESTVNWAKVGGYSAAAAVSYGALKAGHMKMASKSWYKNGMNAFKKTGGFGNLAFGSKEAQNLFPGAQAGEINWGRVGQQNDNLNAWRETQQEIKDVFRGKRSQYGNPTFETPTPKTKDAARRYNRSSFSQWADLAWTPAEGDLMDSGLRKYIDAKKGGFQTMHPAMAGKKPTALGGFSAWASGADYAGRGWQRGAAVGVRGAMMLGAGALAAKGLSYLNPFGN